MRREKLKAKFGGSVSTARLGSCAHSVRPSFTALSPRAIISQARIGGKGTIQRPKKAVHKSSGADDKKLQAVLKRLNVQPIPGIEEVSDG